MAESLDVRQRWSELISTVNVSEDQATPRSGPPISTLSRQCDTKLSTLCEVIVQSEYSQKSPDIEDTLGRFRVWAKNLGAFLPSTSQASLDQRLCNGKEMGTAIRRQLGRIVLVSERIEKIATGSSPNRTRPALETSQATLREVTELNELCQGIRLSIDVLFRLSMLVRQQRPRGKMPLPSSRPRRDPDLDIRHVKDKFPKTLKSPWLTKRLGTSITERRDYILYRQEHHKRLEEHQEQDWGDFAGTINAALSSKATTYENAPIQTEDLMPEPDDTGKRSTHTTATSFMTVIGPDGEEELQIRELDTLKFNGIALDYGEPFECPYCRTIQNVENYHEWKKHVFFDLRPYACTFEDCTSDLFTARHEWFKHELDVHRRQWYCNQCSNQTFLSRSDLAAHLVARHSVDKETQLPLLLSTFQRPIRYFDNQSCPLCDKWTPPKHLKDNVDEYCRHLGRHLQQLSLSALPQIIDGLETIEEYPASTLLRDDIIPLEGLVEGSVTPPTIRNMEHHIASSGATQVAASDQYQQPEVHLHQNGMISLNESEIDVSEDKEGYAIDKRGYYIRDNGGNLVPFRSLISNKGPFFNDINSSWATIPSGELRPDDSVSIKSTTREPVQDAWQIMRKNAEERAATVNEEEFPRYEDDSGEETIESRVNRIKARVAELTAGAEQSENSGVAEQGSPSPSSPEKKSQKFHQDSHPLKLSPKELRRLSLSAPRSGEESIESRVARIKTRVAELTMGQETKRKSSRQEGEVSSDDPPTIVI